MVLLDNMINKLLFPSRSGSLFLALYFKQCRVCLQRTVGEDTTPFDLSVSVSLTRGGLPRIIPSFHRRKIREGDTAVIQLYMNFFSVSKWIPLAPKVTRKTLETVVTPTDYFSALAVAERLTSCAKALLDRYVPDMATIPFKQGLRFIPTWKSVPSVPSYLKQKARQRAASAARRSLFPRGEEFCGALSV